MILIPYILSVLVAVAALVGAGALVAYALRLRGPLLLGFAPAAGAAALSVSATALGFMGIRWSPLSAATAIAVIVGITALATWPLRSIVTGRERSPRWVFGAIALGALLGSLRMAFMIGEPDNVSQTNDATFHLNGLKYIAESGSASSLDLLGATGSSGFYPAAWHALASLTMQLTGVDVAVAANATSVAIAGPVWAISLAGLVWAITRDSRATAASGLLAPTLFAFPFHMLDFGVLYPYALSLAVLPGVIAVLVAGSDEDLDERSERSRIARVVAQTSIVTFVGLAALGFSQPSTLLLWVTAAVAWGLVRVLAPWCSGSVHRRWGRPFTAAVLIASAAVLWLGMVSISSDNLWRAVRNLPDAAARMVVNGSVAPGPALLVSALAVLGFILTVRSARLRWFAIFTIALSLLVLVAQSVQNETVRMFLSPWYADPRRFTAMMPLVVIPLAAIGLAAVSRWKRWHSAGSGTAAVAAVVVLVYVETAAWELANPQEHRYGETDHSYLSTDERALFDDLDEFVEPGARVLGNPSAGAAFGYGLTGVDVVPRTWSMPTDPAFQTLRSELVKLADDPDVCPAVESLGVDYVLDFGESEEGAGKWEMPGLTGFEGEPGFTLVAERGAASLWRINGCD